MPACTSPSPGTPTYTPSSSSVYTPHSRTRTTSGTTTGSGAKSGPSSAASPSARATPPTSSPSDGARAHNPPGERVYPSRARTQRPVLMRPLQARTLRDADYIHIVPAKHRGQGEIVPIVKKNMSRLALVAVVPLADRPPARGQVQLPARHLHLRRHHVATRVPAPALPRLVPAPRSAASMRRPGSTAQSSRTCSTCTARTSSTSPSRPSPRSSRSTPPALLRVPDLLRRALMPRRVLVLSACSCCSCSSSLGARSSSRRVFFFCAGGVGSILTRGVARADARRVPHHVHHSLSGPVPPGW